MWEKDPAVSRLLARTQNRPSVVRMTEIHPDQRVAILADAQNLYHTAQSLYSRNIDYSSLLQKGTAGRALTRAIAYVIRADSPDEGSFSKRSSSLASRHGSQDIKTFQDGSKRADWDVGIASTPSRWRITSTRSCSVRATATSNDSVRTSATRASRRGDGVQGVDRRGTHSGR